MEEPFNFRSIHSGSISFGRFETEPLSWERWSSFSHNRYLEEAGKYSTPGSVTKKKAYFEAHFKKKALLHQTHTENQNSVEYQITENDILDHMNYMEEFEHADVGSHFIHYDASPNGSSSKFDINVTPTLTNDHPVSDGDQQDYAKALTNDNAVLDGFLKVDALLLTNDDTVLNGDLQDEASALTYDDEVLDGDQHDVEPAEMHHTLNTLPLVKDEPEVELKDKPLEETKNMETLTGTSSAPKSRVTLKDDSPSLKNSQRQNLKVKATTKTKTAKTKMMVRVPRNISSEAPKESPKNPRREKESILRTKTEKTSVPKALQTASSLARTSKPEDPENLRAKLGKDNKSEKDLKVKKTGTKSQHSTPEKSEPKTSQSADRPRRTVNSTNSDAKSTSVTFHFKSDERAVKRKEFYVKLEEKMYTKEAEINQIQAITQDEADAEVEQICKILNFKATPMPSFYHEAAPRGSDGRKVESSHLKSKKSQSKLPSPRCTVAGIPPPSSKAGSQQGLSASESENTAAQPQALEGTHCLPTMVSELSEITPNASTSKNCTSKILKRSDSMGKKNIEKGKNCKQQGSGGIKLKEDSIEGRRAVGAVGRSRGELVGKTMKRVGSKDVGGGCGMDHLAVRVAS